MSPRSLWNGTVAFGLVSVPVKLHTATDARTVRFHEVHEPDGARIEHRRFCSAEDREVPYDEVVKGHEVAPGEYVVVGKDEIAAAAGPRTRIIDIEAFVAAGDVDPVFYAKTYFLGAGRDGAEGYRLLHDALERTGRAGIGRFTFHNREYLVAIRPYDSVLALHTMRFADELVEPGEIELEAAGRGPSDRELDMARRLLESLEQPFDPSARSDEHRDAVLDLIERKAAGRRPRRRSEPPAEASDDLLAALEASLKAAR